MASTVASITPASTPFQPACTAATTCCWLTIATGAQSATLTESTILAGPSPGVGLDRSRMGSSITTVGPVHLGERRPRQPDHCLPAPQAFGRRHGAGHRQPGW
jgi:hypothetical protein